ncbi:MAG: hypothetical protein KGR26_11260 [Cyanobacteria bacterium REEB65]|nr:hypothetical protein [Cyanobacteria bacterium REEB65]
MKHASDAALDRLEPLLVELRRFPSLRERKRGVFYRKGAAFLHFHEDAVGLFVDFRPESTWIRQPISTESQWAEFLQLLDSCGFPALGGIAAPSFVHLVDFD